MFANQNGTPESLTAQTEPYKDPVGLLSRTTNDCATTLSARQSRTPTIHSSRDPTNIHVTPLQHRRRNPGSHRRNFARSQPESSAHAPVHGEAAPPTVSSSVHVHLRLIQVTPACAELRQCNADQLSCFSARFSLRQYVVPSGQACRKARSLRLTRLLVLLAPHFARRSLVRCYTSNVYIWYSFSTVSYYLTKLEDYAPTPMPTKHRPRHRPPRRRSRWPSWAWRGRGACGACCPRRRCGGRGWRGRGRGGSRRPWPGA